MYVKVLWLLTITTGEGAGENEEVTSGVWASSGGEISRPPPRDGEPRAGSASPESGWSHALRPDIWRESRLTIHQDDSHLTQISCKFCSPLSEGNFGTWNKPRGTFYYGSKRFFWTAFTRTERTELLQLWSETRTWVGRCHSNVIWGGTPVTQE